MGWATLLLYLAGLVLVSCNDDIDERIPRIRERAFKAGTTYVYSGITQYVTGFPEMSPVYSVVYVKYTIHLQFKTATKVVMKVEDMKVFQLNGRIEAVDPTNEIIPEDLLVPHETPEVNEMRKFVALPVTFRYTNGMVSNIEVEADDPVFSVNCKKAIISMFQVNLDKAKAVEVSEKVVSDMYAGEVVSEAYTVMETSPVGECECTYAVQELTEVEEEERVSGSAHFRVTKVRNYKNCLHRPEFIYDTFGAKRCEQCEPWEVEPVKSSSEAHYILTGTKEEFLIHEAVMESRHFLTPHGPGGTYAATIINQTITLISSDTIRAPLSEPRVPKECPEGVKNIIPEILLHEKRHIASTAMSQAPREIIEIEEPIRSAPSSKMIIKEAVMALRGVAIDMTEGITEEGPTLSSIAVDILRRCTREELNEIWQTYGIEKTTKEPVMKNMRAALWNLLPFTGTVPATEVLCEAIQAKQIPPTQVANAVLPYLAMAAYPIPDTVERLLTLTRSEFVNEHRHMRRSAWFTLGAIVFRMEKMHREKEEELTIQLEKTQRILTFEGKGKIRKQLQWLADRISMLRRAIVSSREQVRGGVEEALTAMLKSPKTEDKIIALKAIGNAGMPEMIPFVVQLIEDKKAWPVIVRQQAVYSLRRIAEKRPTEIVTVLLPVFMDKAENELIRIAAYTTILKGEPPAAILEMMARTLNVETNPQVGSYVYSSLTKLSNSTYPCLLSFANNATYALKFAKLIPSDISSSFVEHYSYASESWKLARLLEISVIGSRDSILPRGASFTFLAHALGHSINLGEIGIEARGLQAILDKLLGPEGMLTKGKSVFDIVRPRRSLSARRVVDGIVRDLKVVAREAEDTVIDIYMRYQGHDMIFYTVDATFITELIESGSIFTSISEESLRSGLEWEGKRPLPWGGVTTVIPTESGVPFRTNLYVGSVVGCSAKWTTAVEPSLFESFRRGQKPTSFKAAFNIKPSMVTDVIGMMCVEVPYALSGARISARTYVNNMHIAGNIEADLIKGKWFSSFEAPTEEKKVAGITVTPSVFFMTHPSEFTPKPLIEVMEVTVEETGAIWPINVELPMREGCNYGITAAVRGQLCTGRTRTGYTFPNIFGRQNLIVTIKPDEVPAKKMEIAIQLVRSEELSNSQTSSAAYSARMSKWWRSIIWGKDAEQTQGSTEELFDLRSSDMSIAAVGEQTHAPLLQAGKKMVIAMTFRAVGTEPPKAFFVQTITQQSLNDKRVTFNAKLTGNMCGHKKQAFIALTTNFLREGTTVEEIVKPEYQHMVREDIKLSSLADPLQSEVINIENRESIIEWQRALTALAGVEVPKYRRDEEEEEVVIEPRIWEVKRIIERLIIKQERLARRLADPALQRMTPEEEEVIEAKLESIIEEAREIEREVREAQEKIRSQVMNMPAKKTIFFLCLKMHRAIRQHQVLIEQLLTLASGSPLSGQVRDSIQRQVRDILHSIEELMEKHRQIMQEIRVPEEEQILPQIGIEFSRIPSLARIWDMSNKQIEIFNELLKIKMAISKGAKSDAIFPRMEQVLEHCREVQEKLKGIVMELRSEEVEEVEEERGVQKPVTILPHTDIYKVILQQEQIHATLKLVCMEMKMEESVTLENVRKVEEELMEQVLILNNIMALEYDIVEKFNYDATMSWAKTTSVPHLPVYMNTYFNFTYSCETCTTWTITGKVLGTKTLEQLLYEMKQGEAKTRDPLVTRILEDKEKVPLEEIERLETEINTLRKLTVEVNYPEIKKPVLLQKAIAMLKEYTAAMTVGRNFYDAISITTPVGQARLDMQFTKEGERLNVAVMTPESTWKILGLKSCPYVPAGVNLQETNTNILEISKAKLRATCAVGIEKVETFDGRLYSIPEILECEKVLAMDCSPAKSFAITLVPRERERVIKVAVEGHIVEIIPRPRIAETILKINGEVVALPENGPLVIRGEGEYSSTPVELTIEREEKEIIMEAPMAGIVVIARPQEIHIQASLFFRSKLCGVCGNFDGQIVRELEDPERRIHAKPESLSISYVLASEKCDRESLFRKYPAKIISQPEGECNPIRRNDIKERIKSGVKRVCISTSAIKRCPPGCRASEEIVVTRGYHCLRADDPSVLEMVEESRHRVLEELITREVDRYEEARQPERCIPL